MGWIRLDDRITEHPKIAAAGPLGFAMFVAGIVYCNRNLTDGFIPRSVVATLLDDEWTDFEGVTWRAAAHSGFQGADFDCIEVADHLADIGLFHKVDGNDDVTRYGYRIHDYEDFQPSRAQVLAEREKTAERVQRHREKRMAAKDSSSSGNAVTNAAVTTPPTPTPSTSVELANASPTAQQLVAEYVEAVQELGAKAESRSKGMVAQRIGQLLSEGHEPETISAAIHLMIDRRLHPSTLPTLLLEASAGPARKRRELSELDQDFVHFAGGSA